MEVPKVTLGSSGVAIPVIGLGTCSSFPPVDSETTKFAVIEAIKSGYRHFDTAYTYETEQALGEAISESLYLGLIKSRNELHITTKLCGIFAARGKVVDGIKASLKNLDLEYVDLFLIHWPLRFNQHPYQPPSIPKELIEPLDIKLVWEGMEECYSLGLAKVIGVSNFYPQKLEEILAIAKIPPAVNQVEMNPFWKQKKLREFCKDKGIHITAYSPLGANGTLWGDNRVLSNELISQIGKAKGKTTAQVALRWVYEQGVSLVTKSFNKERMKENLGIFDWSLTQEEANMISQLPESKCVKLTPMVGPHDLVLEMDAQL